MFTTMHNGEGIKHHKRTINQDVRKRRKTKKLKIMNPIKLLEMLSLYGGAIVSSGECSNMEISDAHANGRLAVMGDGCGYVLRSKEWLALQKSREPES